MPIAPITGLFGANSSGKSSILQLLLLLKQTVESPDLAQVLNFGDERAFVNLGTFRDVAYHAPDTDQGDLSWSLEWTLPKPLEVDDPERKNAVLFSAKQLQFEANIGEGEARNRSRLAVNRFRYRLLEVNGLPGPLSFGMRRRTNDPNEKAALYDFEYEGFDFKRMPGRPWPLPPPIKCYGFPAQVSGYYQNAGFLPVFDLAFEELFGRIYYLGPLREYPQRQYIWGGGQPTDMGRRGERVVDALLASRERGEKIARGPGHRRFAVEEYVAWWLRELGLIHAFSVERISEGSNLYRVRVQKTPEAAQVLITDVGFGVSQILPVLALCYYVPEGSTLLLEQPEIHLHPSVQAGLADVFIDAIQKRKIQIILESHSEHLLIRLQRRIAEEKIAADQVALYFCQRQTVDARLIPLDVDLFGNITNWPKEFFGDKLTEREAMLDAAIKRRKRGEAA